MFVIHTKNQSLDISHLVAMPTLISKIIRNCPILRYYKIEKEKQYNEKNCLLFLRKQFQLQNITTFAELLSFPFSCTDLLHGNCLLNRFNFSINILLVNKNNFVLNFCYAICSIICCPSVLVVFLGVVLLLRQSPALHMFHYSMVFPLFCHYSVVPPVFRCSTCSWFYHSCSNHSNL